MEIQPTKHLSIQTDENKPDHSGMVPMDLINKSEEDYLTMRLLVPYGNTLQSKIVHNGAECIEKIMKAYLMTNGIKTVKEVGRNHNLEVLRKDCAASNTFFVDEELQDFCENYSGDKRGNNVLRYGFDDNTTGYGLNPGGAIQLVDKYFLRTMALLGDGNFHLYNSRIASLFYPTHLQGLKNGNIPPEVLAEMRNAVERENAYLGGFVKHVQELDDNLKASTLT